MTLKHLLDTVENVEIIVKVWGNEIWNTACFGWRVPSFMEDVIIATLEVTLVESVMDGDKEVILVATLED